jgi:hypothetical protein
MHLGKAPEAKPEGKARLVRVAGQPAVGWDEPARSARE